MKVEKKKVPEVTDVVCVISWQGQYLLRKRPKHGNLPTRLIRNRILINIYFQVSWPVYGISPSFQMSRVRPLKKDSNNTVAIWC